MVLHEARAIKYADFVTPGHQLVIKVQQTKSDDRLTHFRFSGEVEDRISVSGRLVLERYNLGDTDPRQADIDQRMIEYQRQQAKLLTYGIDAPVAVS